MEFAASSSSMLSQWSLQSAARKGRVLSAAEETLKMVLLRYTAQRFSCVLGMLSSLEVKVLRPT